jgi:hypothetical protein
VKNLQTLKLNFNLKSYVFDFFILNEFFILRKVNKTFKDIVANKKSFIKFISFLNEKYPIRQHYIDSIIFHNEKIEMFNANDDFIPSEKQIIENNLFSRIFNIPLDITLTNLPDKAFENLKRILDNESCRIKCIKVRLLYIHFYYFSKKMKKLINTLVDSKSIKRLEIQGISNGHIEFFKKLLDDNENMESLVLISSKKDKYNFEFDYLLKDTTINELCLRGSFVEKDDVKRFEKFFKMNNSLNVLDLSQCNGVISSSFFVLLKKKKSLISLNIGDQLLDKQCLLSLLSSLRSNKTLKELIINEDKCEDKALFNKIIKKILSNN